MVRAIVMAVLLAGYAACSYADGAPSDESIRELMRITRSKSLLDGMLGQVDTIMQNGIRQGLGGRTITAEQQDILDGMRRSAAELIRENLRWEQLEPEFAEVYRKFFTQSELDDMIAFYRTPAGQALLAKLPAVMQSSMQLVQKHMQALSPRLQLLQRDTEAKLKATIRK